MRFHESSIMLLLYRGEEFDPNFYYHSGVDIDHSFLLLDGRKKALLTSSMNYALARSSFRGRVVAFRDPLKSISKIAGRKALSVDKSSLSARMAERLRKLGRLKDASAELIARRAVKRPDEVSLVRKAARKTREIFHSLDFGKARTELDLKKQLLLATLEEGLEPAFEPIVATGSSTAFPHYRAGKRRLGSLVLVDYGVRCGHYCSDLSRCFILDGDRKRKAEYEKLEGVCHGIIDRLPELEKGKDVAKLSEKLLEKAGFPKLIHAIGHGVGLEIHESPHLGLKSEDKLAKTVLAIEPAFYYPGRYGMRYEETVWFDGKKARIL